MMKLLLVITLLCMTSVAQAVSTGAPQELKDLYFGETLYYAFQEEWFEAISLLDTELAQHRGLDQPELDSLYVHLGLAEFAVGDFELAYRMHRRAGRAITEVINGDVPHDVRNEAIYRLATIYYHKDQPLNALYALERIEEPVSQGLRADLDFLRGQVLMANGRHSEAVGVLLPLQDEVGMKGFAGYNLGIAMIQDGRLEEGRGYLDQVGQLKSDDPVEIALKDRANLYLGDKLLQERAFEKAKRVFDRVRLDGPFSSQALLKSGWADASLDFYDRALVPWTLLLEREVTDSSVQDALLAAPYAYGKLGVYSKAALLYGAALEAFSREIGRLDESIRLIREGRFLETLAREELQQDASWVVRLRELPDTPETYYLLELMASHDFQESLHNYLDLDQLRRRLETWRDDLDAYDELIARRKAYYDPLLPAIDARFRELDSLMRLRLEQRERIERRFEAMLVAPRPDYLATAEERVITDRLEEASAALLLTGQPVPADVEARIRRIKGLLSWRLQVGYDARLTETFTHLEALDRDVEELRQSYSTFVRVRQAATQSYQGYGDDIRRQRMRIGAALGELEELQLRQGHLIEIMAVNELTRRRERLEEFQVKARFAMADSYDRAVRAGAEERVK
ncbi:MAG: hypothetical protein RQ754_10170 [Desulfuromonadales bacterium]|nr:hypothetical protein [Desulfuromonadales bacterium]